MNHTAYTDPSGLYADNISSAYDMARLISYASEDDRIGPIMRTPEYSFRTIPAPRRSARVITVRNTNQILRNGDMDVVGGKTGFISKAGYCLATLLKMPSGGPSLAVVVLGATSNLGRFWETRHLMAWLADAHRRAQPRDASRLHSQVSFSASPQDATSPRILFLTNRISLASWRCGGEISSDSRAGWPLRRAAA